MCVCVCVCVHGRHIVKEQGKRDGWKVEEGERGGGGVKGGRGGPSLYFIFPPPHPSLKDLPPRGVIPTIKVHSTNHYPPERSFGSIR